MKTLISTAPRRLLTRKEVGDILRMSLTKLHCEVKAGNLRVLQFGRHVRIEPEELERFIQSARTDSTATGKLGREPAAPRKEL